MKKGGGITAIIGFIVAWVGLDQFNKGFAHGFEEAFSIFAPVFTKEFYYPGAFSRGIIMLPLGIIALITGIVIFIVGLCRNK